MATTVITGRDLALTIDSKTYDAQATTASLKVTLQRDIYETLDGKVFNALDTDSILTVTMLADWGATNSLCEAMWTAASSAPNTQLAYTFTAASGAVFTGFLYPSFPDVDGTGKDAQSITIAFQATAKPTLTIS